MCERGKVKKTAWSTYGSPNGFSWKDKQYSCTSTVHPNKIVPNRVAVVGVPTITNLENWKESLDKRKRKNNRNVAWCSHKCELVGVNQTSPLHWKGDQPRRPRLRGLGRRGTRGCSALCVVDETLETGSTDLRPRPRLRLLITTVQPSSSTSGCPLSTTGAKDVSTVRSTKGTGLEVEEDYMKLSASENEERIMDTYGL
jgi:hypothetical protein